MREERDVSNEATLTDSKVATVEDIEMGIETATETERPTEETETETTRKQTFRKSNSPTSTLRRRLGKCMAEDKAAQCQQEILQAC